MGLGIQEAKKIASDIVVKLTTESTAFHHGCSRFNDDCVDWCIACWILGEDPYVKAASHPFLSMSKKGHGAIWIDFRNKCDGIERYKDKWCPKGKEERGLNYLCRGISYYQN